MKQGVLIYAFNNEQVDYVELAYYAAKQVKKFLDMPIAIVTDSLNYLHTKYLDCNEVFSYVIRVDVKQFDRAYQYPVNRLKYIDILSKKIIIENVFNQEVLDNNFQRVYEGITIDKWYPNLPYLAGQHVWNNNILYKCHTDYEENDVFSINQYDIILENVKDLYAVERYKKGDILLYDRVLWLSQINYDENTLTNTLDKAKIGNLERVYEGITIDKWYPNLPYLAGQHVWNNNILYKCHTDYEEGVFFSINQYDIILENVKDLYAVERYKKGDILLYDRVLWLSQINYDENTLTNTVKISDDIWEDMKEIHLSYYTQVQYRKYFDGTLSQKRIKFQNYIRVNSYELSPFEETLVIDCDYILNNDVLKYCWEQNHDFLIHKTAVDLSGYRYDPRLHTLSDKSIQFYWATVFYFKKNKNTCVFFELLKHIQDNWNYYRYVYQIEYALYRNDFVFSIAIHIMNGYQNGFWAQDLPGKLYYTIDKDILISHENNEIRFLIEKEKYKGEYVLMKTINLNVHVMNKFSLSRIIREKENV
jgi:hypothetical protein